MFGVTNFYVDKGERGSYKLHNRLQAFFESRYMLCRQAILSALFFVKNSVNRFQKFLGSQVFSRNGEKRPGRLGLILGDLA